MARGAGPRSLEQDGGRRRIALDPWPAGQARRAAQPAAPIACAAPTVPKAWRLRSIACGSTFRCGPRAGSVRAVQVDSGSESMAVPGSSRGSSSPAPTPKPRSMFSRLARPSSTAPWSAATELGDMSSIPAPTCRSTSTKSSNGVGAFHHLYNNHRPHRALAGMTPAKHPSISRAKHAPPSHMS